MRFITFLILIFSVFGLFAQNDLTDVSLYHNTYEPSEVIDPTYGIKLYEPLNMMLGNDSTRNDNNGYAANGFLEDYYKSGNLLHKGFYVEGQLKIYKNYFPSGNLERNFRMTDLKKSKMTLFYDKEDAIKSDIIYIENEALKWVDYYSNGNVEFEEEYHKSFQYYIKKANYFENGKPENVLELDDKKKLVYTQSYYYDNGNLKEQGSVKYNKAMFDYERIGVWKLFDKNGSVTKQQKYINGVAQ
jgi:antitoxin component YwqK of YwqJK toxin-antitoxin module